MFFVIFLYIARYCQFKSCFVTDNVGGCAFVDFLFAVAVDKALDKVVEKIIKTTQEVKK